MAQRSSALAQKIVCFRPSGSSAFVGIVRFRLDPYESLFMIVTVWNNKIERTVTLYICIVYTALISTANRLCPGSLSMQEKLATYLFETWKRKILFRNFTPGWCKFVFTMSPSISTFAFKFEIIGIKIDKSSNKEKIILTRMF